MRINGWIGRRIVSCCAFACAGLSGWASAQVAPAGNAHPESQLVGEGVSEPHAVFGAPSLADRPAPRDKHAFAERLDLTPLRDLAVFHGRVKILDTMARETVRTLTGRDAYFDLAPSDEGGGAEKLAYDPLFTLLDIMIDPPYYLDKPVIAINYLPLRREIVERAFPGAEQETVRQRYLKLTRVTPRMIRDFAGPIFDDHAGEEPFRDGINRAEAAVGLLLNSAANLRVIAPESTTEKWHHLIEWPTDAEVRVASAELGAAWHARDAERANAAIARLASVLPSINAEMYPDSRRSLELTYNRVNAFEWGYWAYAVSLLMLVLAFGTSRRWLVAGGVAMLLVAIALHTFGFVARSIIAERFAIQNQFESMTGLSLFAAVVGFVIMVARRQWLFGAAAAATGFLVLITATQTGIPGEFMDREAAILNTSVLLKYHVTTVLTSYGLITLGFVISIFYLSAHYGARFFGRSEAEVVAVAALSGAAGDAKDAPAKPTLTRTLADLDTAQMVVLQLAFWTLGVGTLLGAWWADHSWGRWWAFDPKETWALVTWIVYLIVIHARFTSVRDKGLMTAWLSVIGFFVMLWTYFGVNLLLPGLHAYA